MSTGLLFIAVIEVQFLGQLESLAFESMPIVEENVKLVINLIVTLTRLD